MTGLSNLVIPNVRFRNFLDEGTAPNWVAAQSEWLSLKNGVLTVTIDRGVGFFGIGTEPGNWEEQAGGSWVILAYGWELRLCPVLVSARSEMVAFYLDVGVAPGYGEPK
jgi:hypothetical protein